MRTVIQTNTTNVYKYDELSEEAKKRAYTKWLNGREYFWANDADDCIHAVEDLFDVKLNGWEFSSWRSDYGTIDWKYWDYDQLNLKGKRAITFAWNNWADKLFKPKSYRKGNKSRNSKYLMEHKEYDLTGIWLDGEATNNLVKFMTYNEYDEYKTVKELIEDSFYNLFKAIQRDCEYQESRECFEENDAREFEYTENGNIY